MRTAQAKPQVSDPDEFSAPTGHGPNRVSGTHRPFSFVLRSGTRLGYVDAVNDEVRRRPEDRSAAPDIRVPQQRDLALALVEPILHDIADADDATQFAVVHHWEMTDA
jgi:hypothetical protein